MFFNFGKHGSDTSRKRQSERKGNRNRTSESPNPRPFPQLNKFYGKKLIVTVQNAA